MPLFDTHCHLHFNPPSCDAAFFPAGSEEENAQKDTTRFACMSCSPKEFLEAKRRFEGTPHVLVASGLHPRWIADGACGSEDCDLLCELAEKESLVGEIGLDFLAPYAHAKEQQVEVFSCIVSECARIGGKTLSIHALRSADAVLDLIEKHRATESCRCIMHWFSGSCEELHRAVKAGCWFSVNNRMLATKKGREYARIIPEDRLLLESDLPADVGETASRAEIESSLEETLSALESIRRKPCRESCYRNACELFGSWTQE